MNKASILIVEDESVVALNMSHILTSLGYRVLGPVGTGPKALALIESDPPDLVLLDIKLRGGMDGIEVAEQIRAGRHIPIVYVTTYTDDLTLSRAKVTEPYGYITKTFEDRELHSTIEMALYKYQMEQSLLEKDEIISTTLNSIREAVVTADGSGHIRFTNLAAQNLLSLGVEQAQGRKIEEVLHLSDTTGERILAPFTKTNIEAVGSKSYRCSLMTDAGCEIPVLCSVSPLVPGGQTTGFAVVLRDISQQVHAEATQAQLAAIVDSSEDGIISTSLQGEITSWNPAAERMFGYSADEVLGLNLSVLSPDSWPDEVPAIISRLSRGETIEDYETIHRRKNGEIIDVSLRASVIRDYAGTVAGMSLIARDITARKDLNKRLLEMRNREQARIGRDLHDSLGQQLTGILFRVKALELRHQSQASEELRRDASEIGQLVKEALLKTRELAAGLIPATLQSLGLKDALAQLTANVAAVCDLKVHFHCPREVSVTDQVIVTELYHIAEEALTNAVKHAEATHVEVRLDEGSSELTLSIQDDGKGIPVERSRGLGLRIMDYRANSIDARLSATSLPGQGTLVVCRLPLDRSSKGGRI